jgi:cysteinyl-tRNA synthetase
VRQPCSRDYAANPKKTETMKTLHLCNTMSRRLERFRPRAKGEVKIFTCGPSIYDRPHIGNYRTYIYEDILERYLQYLGYRTKRVINFTDVEDKSIARIQKLGKTLAEVTEPNAAAFRRDAAKLNIRLPACIPRSSTCIEPAVELIKVLLKKGYAYRHGRDIFYDPLKFKGFGKLYRLDMSRWPARKRRFAKDTYPGRRWNLGDFILWHGCRPEWGGGVCWETELGKGRPAWNVQDPAVIAARLGYQVDISCGGIDNIYRHHDYNIAVMEGVSGQEFARYWLHGEHVLLDGRKMSKSKGNILYPDDLTAKGFSYNHIRFHLLRTHYRRKINLTDRKLSASRELLDAIQVMVRGILTPRLVLQNDTAHCAGLISALGRDFEQAMNNDLDTNRAVKGLGNNLAKLATFVERQGLKKEQAAAAAEVLGGIDSVLQVLSLSEGAGGGG